MQARKQRLQARRPRTGMQLQARKRLELPQKLVLKSSQQLLKLVSACRSRSFPSQQVLADPLKQVPHHGKVVCCLLVVVVVSHHNKC